MSLGADLAHFHRNSDSHVGRNCGRFDQFSLVEGPEWNPDVGVFVPDSAAGQVTIAATGTDASGAARTAIPQDENIVAGQTNGPTR